MEIFLDKDFVAGYWTTALKDDPVWRDFEKGFLKQIRNFKLITNYTSQLEMMDDEKGLHFLELFADKVSEIEYNDYLMKDVWIENHIKKKGGYRIFLVELDVIDCAHFRSIFGYEFISTKNLGVVWKKYLTKEIKKSVDVQPDPKDQELFNGWQDLSFVGQCPTNSIVIIDKYILCNKYNQRLKDNLIPLLEILIPEKYMGRIDLLIMSEEFLSEQRDRPTDEKVKDIYNHILTSIYKFKSIEFKINILVHNKAFYPFNNMIIHDRIIYTNYYTIESGPGFNLFEGKKRLCVNSTVDIHFNFQPFYMKVLPRHIESLKKYIDKLKRVEVHNMFKYYPDTECKLLN